MQTRLGVLGVFLVLLAGCGSLDLEPPPPYLAVRGRGLRPVWGVVRYLANHSYVVWRRQEDAVPRVTERNYRGVWHAPSKLWNHDHETYTLLTGEAALEAIAELDRVISEHPNLERYNDGYVAWPGPNSNSFTADVCARASIPVDLPPTSVAKDWPALIPFVFDAGLSSTRTGFHLDLLSVIGLQLGLREGLELHLLGSTVGVDFWPPALKLPVAGRLGFQEGAGVERVSDLWEWVEAKRADPDPRVRAQVAAAVGSDSKQRSWGKPDATARMTVLLELLGDPHGRVRAQAAASLIRRAPFSSWLEWAWFKGDQALGAPLLFKRLTGVVRELSDDPAPTVRAQAIELVGLLAEIQHRPELNQIVRGVREDASPVVRERALAMAEQLGIDLSGE